MEGLYQPLNTSQGTSRSRSRATSALVLLDARHVRDPDTSSPGISVSRFPPGGLKGFPPDAGATSRAPLP